MAGFDPSIEANGSVRNVIYRSGTRREHEAADHADRIAGRRLRAPDDTIPENETVPAIPCLSTSWGRPEAQAFDDKTPLKRYEALENDPKKTKGREHPFSHPPGAAATVAAGVPHPSHTEFFGCGERMDPVKTP